jgi:tRNA 2-selenouridine synthase
MDPQIVHYVALLQKKEPCIIDVRSPCEFASGHIPNAINIPLFSDEERKQVGIVYKNEGQRAAIEKGLSLISLPLFVEKLKNFQVQKEVFVYCARGGMRSQAMGWLFGLLGLEVQILKGGYKAFRNWVVSSFQKSYNFLVLAGKTGVGKTELLRELKNTKEKVLDLEEMAEHRGSAFGALQKPQPTQEQFENLLSLDLFHLQEHLFWVEDESRFIGKMRIPDGFFDQMLKAKVVVLSSSLEERLERIVQEYSSETQEKLLQYILQLKKSLGGLATEQAIRHLQEKNYAECCKILLTYYDKRYERALEKRDPSSLVFLHKKDFSQIASLKEILLKK